MLLGGESPNQALGAISAKVDLPNMRYTQTVLESPNYKDSLVATIKDLTRLLGWVDGFLGRATVLLAVLWLAFSGAVVLNLPPLGDHSWVPTQLLIAGGILLLFAWPFFLAVRYRHDMDEPFAGPSFETDRVRTELLFTEVRLRDRVPCIKFELEVDNDSGASISVGDLIGKPLFNEEEMGRSIGIGHFNVIGPGAKQRVTLTQRLPEENVEELDSWLRDGAVRVRLDRISWTGTYQFRSRDWKPMAGTCHIRIKDLQMVRRDKDYAFPRTVPTTTVENSES